MSALPTGCFGFHGAIHSFVLARDHEYRDLLASGKYVEATGLDEMEADVALEDLAETNPARLNVFFRSIGMALPADGPRRSVHGPRPSWFSL